MKSSVGETLWCVEAFKSVCGGAWRSVYDCRRELHDFTLVLYPMVSSHSITTLGTGSLTDTFIRGGREVGGGPFFVERREGLI